jgi:hypothetical protein
MKILGSLTSGIMGAAAALILAVGTVGAATLPLPKERALLEVTGNVANTNLPEKAVFDLAMLEGIGITKTKTSTAWNEGQPVFEGVLLKALLDHVGASGTTIVAVALNDYKVEIPIEDFNKYPVILAYRMDGQPLRVRDKGPLWIIYPQDDFPNLKDKQTQAKWVWQVKEIRVK